MPIQIDAQLTPEALARAEQAWCDMVVTAWTDRRPPSSSEYHEKKGFSRDNLLTLALIARRGDDGFRAETSAPGGKLHSMKFLVEALYREFGFTIGFLHHAREILAPEMGFHPNKTTGIKERDDRGGKIHVNARMLKLQRQNPFVVPYFVEWCRRKNIGASNPAFVNFLEDTGRYKVALGAIKESTRKPK